MRARLNPYARLNPASFQVFHADHGITDPQMEHIKGVLEAQAPIGFFVRQIDIPAHLGRVPNALYGPAAGDPPIQEDQVFYAVRGDRPFPDRMIRAPVRPWRYVQAIGVRADADNFKLFTVYGGPLAPMHPDAPNNPDPTAARLWWAQHALSNAQWDPSRGRP